MNAIAVEPDPMLSAALSAAGAGLAVVYQKGKRAFAPGWNKGPALTADQLRAAYRPGLNIALRAGTASRIEGEAVVVLDVDLRGADETELAAARAAYAELVGTLKPTVRTGGGGVHVYLRMPDGKLPTRPATVLRQSAKRFDGKPAWTIELLADGHAVTMPPSVHPSGKRYAWANGGLEHIERAPGSLLSALPAAPTSLAAAESQESQESQGAPVDEPEPLRRPVPPALPYPIAELGPVIGPACEEIRRVIQAPDAVCAASLLAAASLATQGLADVHIDGRVHPLSLWLLTVAESGERKSAVDAEAMRGVRDAEHALHEVYRAALAQHEADAEQWNVRRDRAKTDARRRKGSGLADELQSIGPEPEAPLLPFVTVADFTAEGLAKLLRDGRPSVGAFTDEGGLVFGGHGMTQEAVTRTAATLSKLWDRGDMDRIRSLDGATKLYGRRLALHLLVQPVVAERALGDAILSGQGFLARCLLAWPKGTAGARPYVEESLRDGPALGQFTARTRDLLQRPFPLVDGTRNELNPRALMLTAHAKAEWVRAYNAIEAAEAPSGKFAACKIWASKAAEQALRIAGVLTLIENPEAQQIEADTIRRAAEIALWHLNEALRLAGTAEVADDILDAEALLAWCHATGRALLCSTEALQLGPSRVRDRERFVEAVHLLERAGWAEPIDGGAEVGGKRRRNVWRIVPAPVERAEP